MPSTASQPKTAPWLAENGPKQLEQLFRAIVYIPSAPILIADNDRQYQAASTGAVKLLGLPLEKIIGRRIDDFAPPSFKPEISQLWQGFLDRGEQKGVLQLLGPDGASLDVEYTAKENILPVRHLLVLRDKTDVPEADKIPSWVRDFALLLLDENGRIVAWYAGAERMYGCKSVAAVGQPESLFYAGEDAPRSACARS